jgi:hypothetical protein
MKKNYKYHNCWDFAACVIRDKDQNLVFKTDNSICFGFVSRLGDQKGHEKFKWFTTYFVDAWSPSCFYMKAFMLAMNSLNLFRNVHECKIVTMDSVDSSLWKTYVNKAEQSPLKRKPTHVLKLEFDLEKISVVEMFMVINIMRTMQLYPSAVESMFKLHARHPKVDYFKCLLISHALDYSKEIKQAREGQSRNSNHLVAYAGFAWVQASIPEAHHHIDTNFKSPTVKNWNYRAIEWNHFFTHTATPSRTYNSELDTYSKRTFESFLGQSKYEKVLNLIKEKVSNW